MVAAGKIKRAEARDASFCLRMLLSGRADYFITDPYQGRDTMKSAGLGDDALKMSEVVLATRGLHLIVARGNAGGADLIKSFNTGLQSIKKSGKYEQIVQKFAK
jgi:polar amino acid transport system substrate-binding protein